MFFKDLNHGVRLQFLKFVDKHLISVSGKQLKVWEKTSGTLVSYMHIARHILITLELTSRLYPQIFDFYNKILEI